MNLTLEIFDFFNQLIFVLLIQHSLIKNFRASFHERQEYKGIAQG